MMLQRSGGYGGRSGGYGGLTSSRSSPQLAPIALATTHRSHSLASSVKDPSSTAPFAIGTRSGSRGANGASRKRSSNRAARMDIGLGLGGNLQQAARQTSGATPSHCAVVDSTRGVDQQEVEQHCSISTEGDPTGEIRTRVFRIGAPLLRSTIPIALGTPRKTDMEMLLSARGERTADDDEDSDVESVFSLSNVDPEDQCALSLTLDFPC